MVAGLNMQLNVWRISFSSDDDIGGAQPTGTVIYQRVPARMRAIRPDQIFLQQGLETQKIFVFTVPSNYLIYERDELEVTSPISHRYLNERFRVVGNSESSFHPNDARGFLLLSTTRSERSHASQ